MKKVLDIYVPDGAVEPLTIDDPKSNRVRMSDRWDSEDGDSLGIREFLEKKERKQRLDSRFGLTLRPKKGVK